jgi:putative hemolysin
MWTEFLLIVGLIVLNGAFAGAEIAVVALRSSRIRELSAAGSRTAKALERLRGDPERFLSTVQVVITVVGAAAAAFGGAAFAEDLAPYVAKVPALEPHADDIALGAVVALISYLSLVLGELVPKSLALRAAERYALLMARPLLVAAWLLKPGVSLLTWTTNLLLRPFGDRTNFMESRLSLEELRGIMDEASAKGAVQRHAGAIASRALQFAELTAGDVMVHRSLVHTLARDATSAQVRAALLDTGHQRFPVHERGIDNIVGYVSWRDVVAQEWSGKALELGAQLRPSHFVPESRPAPDLLQDMLRQRVHLAVAVDEHGGTAGIVTLEDLLEELVGEISSEHMGATVEAIVRQPDGSALVVASTPIREANRELGLALEEPVDCTTIGGLCLMLSGGRIPRAGEEFRAVDGTRLKVVDATARRVRSVRIDAVQR